MVYEAIGQGNILKVQQLLSQGLDVNCRNKKQMTPLIAAAKHNHFDIARLLCERGADVNAVSYANAADEDGNMSPLLWASINGNIKMAKFFLQRGAKVNQTSIDEFTPLLAAAQKGHLPMVEFLLDSGANLDYSGPIAENSAIKAAVIRGHINVVIYLLSKGANINIRDRLGNSLLMYGQSGSLEMIRILTECGLDINKQNNSGDTIFALLASSPKDQLEKLLILNYLIKKGGNIHLKNSRGQSPLMKAAWAGNVKVVKLFLQSGAVISDTDNDGETPLMVACHSGNAEVAKVLLENGAEIEAQAKNGWTALMAAAKEGSFKCIELLAGRGADLNKRNNAGNNAVDIALQNKHTEVYNYLKSLITKKFDDRLLVKS
jgi:ankyrin repeat protein